MFRFAHHLKILFFVLILAMLTGLPLLSLLSQSKIPLIVYADGDNEEGASPQTRKRGRF